MRALRDQAQADSERAQAQLESSSQIAVTPTALRKFAISARKRLRRHGGGYPRDHLRAFTQRVEVGESHVRIMGSKGELLRTLTADSGEVGGNRRAHYGTEMADQEGFELQQNTLFN